MPAEPKRQPPPDDPEQSKRFIDMAREVGADESPEAFDKAFSEVVRPKEGRPKSPTRNVRRHIDIVPIYG